MCRVGICVGSFMCAGILLLQWQGENFAQRQNLNFWRFQHVHCTLWLEKSYISKSIQPIFEIFAQIEDVEGAHLGGKFHVRWYFTFAMARWKVCALKTFEILPISTCTLCQENPISLKVFNRFSKSLPSSEMLRVGVWVESLRGAGTLFCNSKVKTLRIDNIWKFATFNLYTVPAKILYLQRCSIDFRNLCLSSKMLRVGIWVESFRCAGISFLQCQGEKFAHGEHFKFCQFQRVHCASKNPVSPKVFNRFSKSLPELEDVECGHLGGKFQVRRYFTFGMPTWKLWTSTTFDILPLSTCTLCQQKSYTSKGIQPIFRNLCLGSKMFRVVICVESLRCAGSLLLQWQRWKLCDIENIWNFATFNLYTAPAKILYLQRYSNDFRTLLLISKMVKVGIWVESFRWADILLLQWQGENFATSTNIWKFTTFNLYTVAAKILYLQKYSSDFRNFCLSSKMFRVGICVKSFRCAGFLRLHWQGENFAHRQNSIFCLFQPVHCTLWLQKSYISKSIPPIFEIFAQLEDV